jgi:hypothetical protein
MNNLEKIKNWIKKEINCEPSGDAFDETQYINANKIIDFLNTLQQPQALRLKESDFEHYDTILFYDKNNMHIEITIDNFFEDTFYQVVFRIDDIYFTEEDGTDFNSFKEAIEWINQKLLEIFNAVKGE